MGNMCFMVKKSVKRTPGNGKAMGEMEQKKTNGKQREIHGAWREEKVCF